MELLDMVPADAIAIRIYSLPAAATTVGSLWACWLVAALAAAFGLWCIRAGAAAGSSAKPDAGGGVRSALVEDKQPKRPRSVASSSAVVVDEAAELVAAASSPSEPSSTPCKVRFTAYYGGSGRHDDGVVDGVRRCADGDDNDDGDGEGEKPQRRPSPGMTSRRRSTAMSTTPPWEEREMAVRWRGDLGWYRHLDMSALDGSVVRLWHGEVAAAPPPRRRSRRAGLEFHLSL
ncbi:hypothetical protein GUJ93_ZPchr0002g24857 [Zizania palustris]|uniref:Uncharacterized protein n=1 Tax=Zizania palustris TaxID=103762 RepID=A0A8J5SFJ3_ZIZPA|nr:hypothetical protein GUJ93_ZPchr0002g24857 [Zizania palustris]